MPREAAADDSKGGPASRGLTALSAAVFLAGAIGALLLVAADLSTLIEVRSGGRVTDRVTGGEQHLYALVVLGALALVLAGVLAFTHSRAAATALAGLGIIALAIALLGDLPDLNRSGVTADFKPADASPARAYYLETAGAVLVLLAGAAGAVLDLDPRRR